MRLVAEVNTLLNAIEPMLEIVEESRIHVDGNGIEMRAVDPANVAMVETRIHQPAFETYEPGLADPEDTETIGVKLTRLEEVLDLASGDALATLTLNEDTNDLEINADGINYALTLINPDTIRTEPDIPDLDLNVSARVRGGEIDRGVEAAALVSDHVRFRAVDEDGDGPAGLRIRATGDTDDVELTLPADEIQQFDIEGDAHGSMFSMGYIENVCDPIGSGTDVTLRFGTEFPMKLRYQAADHAPVIAMVAPRIESS